MPRFRRRRRDRTARQPRQFFHELQTRITRRHVAAIDRNSIEPSAERAQHLRLGLIRDRLQRNPDRPKLHRSRTPMRDQMQLTYFGIAIKRLLHQR